MNLMGDGLINLISLFFSFLRIGAFSFGGGYAMIPLVQEETIKIHQWLNMQQFVEIVAIAEMTPGPVAINTATYVGYKVAGFWGSLTATIAVVLPSLMIVPLLAKLIQRFAASSTTKAVLLGIKPAVVGLLMITIFLLGREILTDYFSLAVGIVALWLLLKERIHPILILAIAGCLGLIFT